MSTPCETDLSLFIFIKLLACQIFKCLSKLQEMLLRAQIQAQQQLQQQQQGESTPTSQSIVISQANEMTSVTDPFLGQTNSSDHSRQESTDSGVGRYSGVVVATLVAEWLECWLEVRKVEVSDPARSCQR